MGSVLVADPAHDLFQIRCLDVKGVLVRRE